MAHMKDYCQASLGTTQGLGGQRPVNITALRHFCCFALAVVLGLFFLSRFLGLDFIICGFGLAFQGFGCKICRSGFYVFRLGDSRFGFRVQGLEAVAHAYRDSWFYLGSKI